MVRAHRVVAVALIVAGAGAAIASGDAASVTADIKANVRITATTPVKVLHSRGRQAIVYTVTLANRAAHDETVELTARPPLFTTVKNGTRVGEGAPYEPAGRPVVSSGPATITAGKVVDGAPACSPRANGYNGTFPDLDIPTVLLPAGSTSQVVFRYRTFGAALWRGMDLHPTFELHGPGRSALTAPALFARGPAPKIDGRPAARVELATEPRGSTYFGLGGRHAPVPRGGIRIFGRVDPPTAGRRITLKVAGPDDRRLKPLATVRTDPHGRFSLLHWKPATKGQWEVWAFAAADAAASADTICPVGFDVG